MEQSNHTAIVLSRIKSKFSSCTSERRNLKLPGKQGYIIIGNTVEISLDQKVVSSNMQEDASAFEGWAIVIKYWGEFDRVKLRWEKPSDIHNGHYQRFLFRVRNFLKYNNTWFSVCHACVQFLEDLQIVPNKTYYLNSPGVVRKTDEPHHKEAILEYRFTSKDLHVDLISLTNAEFISRQLPVGIFNNAVSNGNEIFTKGKSAIDLWGISTTNELLIFELKAGDNNKVGIISELFFYVSVMLEVRNDIFIYGQPVDAHLKRIKKTEKIKAYFLAYDLHPLIFPGNDHSILNQLDKMIPDQVEYHFIRIIDDKLLYQEF